MSFLGSLSTCLIICVMPVLQYCCPFYHAMDFRLGLLFSFHDILRGWAAETCWTILNKCFLLSLLLQTATLWKNVTHYFVTGSSVESWTAWVLSFSLSLWSLRTGWEYTVPLPALAWASGVFAWTRAAQTLWKQQVRKFLLSSALTSVIPLELSLWFRIQ